MRHKIAKKHLGRDRAERTQLQRDLTNALVMHEAIITTLPKAKFVRSYVERAITISKKGTLASKRHIQKLLVHKEAEKKLRDDLSSRYAARSGGYTRIVKIGPRKGDQAEMVRLELV